MNAAPRHIPAIAAQQASFREQRAPIHLFEPILTAVHFVYSNVSVVRAIPQEGIPGSPHDPAPSPPFNGDLKGDGMPPSQTPKASDVALDGACEWGCKSPFQRQTPREHRLLDGVSVRS